MKIIQKSLCFGLVAVLGLSTVSYSIFSAHAVADKTFEYTVLSDNTIQIDHYNGIKTEIVIPSQIDGKTVTKIGDKAFEYNTKITNVEMPDSVVSVGDRAFNDCVNLKTVTLSDYIEHIGKGAFFSCTRLTDVILPNHLESLGDGAFYDCESLTDITVPGSVKQFGEYVFGSDSSLKTAVLEDGIQTIPAQTFYCCTELTDVSLPDSLQKIDRRAFYGCQKLKNITLPSSVKEIGEKAFFNCQKITDIHFNGEILGKEAFSDCFSLQELELSNNLKSVGDRFLADVGVEDFFLSSNLESIAPTAFNNSNICNIITNNDNPNFKVIDNVIFTADMTKLVSYRNNTNTAYTVPSTVTEIADYAFCKADKLESIQLPQNLQKIGAHAFEESHLTEITIPSAVHEIEENTFNNCSLLTSVTIGNGVKTIGQDAFSGCSSLTSFTVPNSITELSANSFAGVDILKALHLTSDAPLTMTDNALYNREMTRLFMVATDKTEFTIPDTVQSVAPYATLSSLNNNLETVVVPDSVTKIGEKAIGFTKWGAGNDYFQSQIKMMGNGTGAKAYFQSENVALFLEEPRLNSEAVTLDGGETFPLVLNGALAENVIFSSSDSSIATVDQNGMITGMKKGSTSVIASVANIYFLCRVTVRSDNAVQPDNPFADYVTLSRETIDDWEKQYYQENDLKNATQMDYPAVYCYTTEQYKPIVAIQSSSDSRYLDETLALYGQDYGQYYIFSDNLSVELQRFKLNQNTVFWSGTSNTVGITGTGSTVSDMVNAIGRTYTCSTVISTTPSLATATRFAVGNTPALLQLYVPEGLTKGAYIRPISMHSSEYEFLLDCNLQYEIIDAGYKEISFTSFSDSDVGSGEAYSNTVVIPVIQLKVTDPNPVKPDEESSQEESDLSESSVEQSSQSQESSSPSSSSESSAMESSVIESSEVSPSASSKTESSDDSTVPTGDSRWGMGWIVLLIILSGLTIVIFSFGKQSKNNNQ